MKPFTLPQKFAVGFAITLAVFVMAVAGVYVLLPGFRAHLSPNLSVAGESTQDLKTYDSAEDAFTFPYPADFVTFSLPTLDVGRRIVVESPKEGTGFEITILPFDEPAPLTANRILADLADMTLENPQSTTVGAGIPALSFDSEDEYLGPTTRSGSPMVDISTRPAPVSHLGPRCRSCWPAGALSRARSPTRICKNKQPNFL